MSIQERNNIRSAALTDQQMSKVKLISLTLSTNFFLTRRYATLSGTVKRHE